MALKHFNPTTPGRRQLTLVDRSSLWHGKPEKALTTRKKKTGGRNTYGRITAFNRGNEHKRRYRIVDFKRSKDEVEASVERLEYDPNRTAFIALIRYDDGKLSYILAPQRLSVGDKVTSGLMVDVGIGNALPLMSIPIGTLVHNIELVPGRGGQMARSAGSYARIVGRDSVKVQLRLPSGEIRTVPCKCRATVGSVSNPDQQHISLSKAGRSRWIGCRPTVRGVAMNPIDHPHGGGEGKTSGGRHPCTPWGKPTKGKKTRGKKQSDKFILQERWRS